MFKTGYFISIGAGKNQLPLILKLKELGLKVIAIDQSQDSPGFKHSEIKIIESVWEFRKIYASLLRLFLDEPIVGIGVRSYGKAVLTAAYLADKFGLVGDSKETLKKFYNKKTMKAFLGDKNVLVPKSYTWQNTREFQSLTQAVCYPCILKPVDNIAKLGIEVFHKADALLIRLNQLKARYDRFLLEEFIEGFEITVLGFVQNSKFILISVSDKVTSSHVPFVELSHRLPTTQEKFLGEVKLICQNIANLTGLENSPIVAEFKITSRGEIYLIEVMPEIGGEFLAESLIPEFYTYDYFKNYVYLLTRNNVLPVDRKPSKKNEKLSQICFIAPPEGVSKFISYEELKFENSTSSFLNSRLKNLGDKLNSSDGNSCRVQVIGVTTSIKLKPEVFDSNIRKIYDAKFE